MRDETELVGYGWDWSAFVGSEECLQSNRRDLHKLDFVIPLVVERRVAIQAGGNLGLFPKRLAQEFQLVYTFEPDPQNFAALCSNAPEPNILKVQAALGHRQQMVTIAQGSDTHTHEGVKHVAGPGDIPMLVIDDFNYAICDLLYLDIEGYEIEALRGADKTIDRCLPVVVAEFNEVAERRHHRLQTLISMLTHHRYVPVFKLYTDYVFLPRSKINVKMLHEKAQHLSEISGAISF